MDIKKEFNFKISQDILEIYPLSKETYNAKLVEKDIYKITILDGKSTRIKYYDREQIEVFLSTSYWIVVNDEKV